jgi:O-antigen ligase
VSFQSIKLPTRDLFAGSIALLASALYFLNGFYEIDLALKTVLILISFLALILLVVRYKQFVLYSLAFFIPLSVPFKLPGGTVIQTPTEIICVLLTAFFIIKLLSGKKPPAEFLKHPVTLFVFFDLAWIFITSCTSEMPLVSFKRLIIKIIYYSTFYFFYFELFVLDIKNIKRVVTIHCIGFLIPIFSAIVFHSTLGFTTMGSQLASAPFYNDHTMYGAGLAFLSPFLIISANSARPKKELFLFYTLLLVFATALFLSYSRAAWLSLILSIAVGSLIRFKFKLSYVIIAVTFFVSLTLGNTEKISEFLRANKELSHGNDISQHFRSISNVNTDVSNLERVNRWKCALRMFEDKPVLGFGPGTYQFFYGNYQVRKDMTHISTYSGSKGHAHSEYLNYLSETGLPGLIIFVSLLLSAFYTAVKLIYRLPNGFEKDMTYCLLLGLITFIIHGFFNGFIEFDKLAMPVFVAMAGITALAIRETDLNRSYEVRS